MPISSEALIIRSVPCQRKNAPEDWSLHPQETTHRVSHMPQKPLDVRLPSLCRPLPHSSKSIVPRVTERKWYFTEMSMMMPVQRLMSWRRSTAIHLFIRLMILMLQQDRERSRWKSCRNFRRSIISLCRSAEADWSRVFLHLRKCWILRSKWSVWNRQQQPVWKRP